MLSKVAPLLKAAPRGNPGAKLLPKKIEHNNNNSVNRRKVIGKCSLELWPAVSAGT